MIERHREHTRNEPGPDAVVNTAIVLIVLGGADACGWCHWDLRWSPSPPRMGPRSAVLGG
eukprot:7498055-Pyramimonas_sp.AAC.1